MRLVEDKNQFEKFKIADRDPVFFIEEFDKQRLGSTSNYQAWERTEQQHIELTGAARYSDYESFRCCRNRKKNR